MAQSTYVTADVFRDTEDAFFENLGRIQDRINALVSPSTSNVAPADPAGSAVAPCTGHSNPNAKLGNLERLKLPTFDGDWLNWPNFKGLFESLVHSDGTIPKTLKLQHLKLHLSGEAADLIENTPVPDAGYEGAWQDLLDVYENDILLLFKYMRNIIECKPASKSSASDLKRITSTVKRSKRAFEALKRPVAQWSEWFLFLTVEKLDPSTKMYWQSSLNDRKTIPTFDSLLTFLDTRIQALTVTYAKPTATVKEGGSTSVKRLGGNKKTTVLHSSTSSPSKSKYTCPLCQKGHSLSYCQKFKALSASDRLTSATSLKACLNCLHVNQFANRCRSPPMCQVGDCLQKHHTLMHSTSMKTQSIDGTATPDLAQTPPTVTMATTTARRVVLLATARVRLEAPNGKSVVVRTLLDHAAESSFISEWAAQTLGVSRQRVSIPTSGLQGTHTGEVKTQAIVTLCSHQQQHYRMIISALILPSLSTLLPSETVEKMRWPHLDGLQLADVEFAKPGRIDAILGAEVYGPIVTDNVIDRQTSRQLWRLYLAGL